MPSQNYLFFIDFEKLIWGDIFIEMCHFDISVERVEKNDSNALHVKSVKNNCMSRVY